MEQSASYEDRLEREASWEERQARLDKEQEKEQRRKYNECLAIYLRFLLLEIIELEGDSTYFNGTDMLILFKAVFLKTQAGSCLH